MMGNIQDVLPYVNFRKYYFAWDQYVSPQNPTRPENLLKPRTSSLLPNQ